MATEMNETFEKIHEEMKRLGIHENEIWKFITRCKMNTLASHIDKLQKEFNELKEEHDKL